MSEVRKSKRAKKTVGSSTQSQRAPSPPREPTPPPPAVTPLDEFPELVFSTAEQKRRFIILRGKEIVPTRFLKTSVLTTLEIETATRALFDGLGMSSLFTMSEKTYLGLTLEFFSSFSFDTRSRIVEFRVLNTDHRMTDNAFGRLLGLRCGNEITVDEELVDIALVWRCISNQYYPGSSSMKESMVHHPVIRFWHRIIATTIFGRSEPQLFQCLEVAILESYLNVGRKAKFEYHLGFLVASHFDKVGRSDQKLKGICMGGVVTYITRDRFPAFTGEGQTEVTGKTDIDAALIRTGFRWVKEDKGNWWMIGGQKSVTLPYRDLPALRPTAPATSPLERALPPPRFLIPINGTPPALIQECEPHLRPRELTLTTTPHHIPTIRGETSTTTTSAPPIVPEQPSTSVPTEAREEDAITILRRMEKDAYLSSYHIYGLHVRHGLIPPDAEHPSWFHQHANTYAPTQTYPSRDFGPLGGYYGVTPTAPSADAAVDHNAMEADPPVGHDDVVTAFADTDVDS